MPQPVPIRDTFAVAYEGSIAPLASEAFFEASTPAPLVPTRSAIVRVTVLELPLDEARRVVPGLVVPAPAAVEGLPGGGERLWTDSRVQTIDAHGLMLGPRIRALGMNAGHVEPRRLQQALSALTRRGRVLDTAEGAVAIGSTATITAATKMSFLRSMTYGAASDSVIVDDVDIGRFEHGTQVKLGLRPDGVRFAVELEWLQKTPVSQLDSPWGLQMPVIGEHRVQTSATVTMAGPEAVVVGSLPGRARGTVQLLCVEIAPPRSSVGSR
ncbi:MAG: hypothetical protein KDC98_00750 [Planctomycetes bacterium]|nr:hypothetical protein [Planctomycetota bacterium]